MPAQAAAGHRPPPGATPGAGYVPGYGQPHGACPAPPGAPLAEWWRRLLARLIDGALIGLMLSPLWALFLLAPLEQLAKLASLSGSPYVSPPALAGAEAYQYGRIIGVSIVMAIISAPLAFGYDWLQHALWGKTVGKRVLGTRVVSAATRLPVSGGAACGRAALYALVALVPVAGGIFCLLNEAWLMWDPRRQCLHDKASGTIVVRA